MFRTKVTISLLKIILGLLQPLHSVLDLQINLRLVKMVPNDSLCPKTLGQTPKNKSLACSEPKLQFHSLKSSLASYRPSTLFLTFRWIWGSRKWSQWFPMIKGGHPVRAWGPRGLVLGQRVEPKGALLGGWGDQILAFLVKIEMACSNRKKRARALKLFVGHQWPKRPTKSCGDYGKLNFHILCSTLVGGVQKKALPFSPINTQFSA